MIEAGTDLLDIGGYSTRPGADDVPPSEERRRVEKAISLIHKQFPDARISIDTFRAEVARAAVEAGARLINDVSGGQADPAMFTTAAQLRVPYIAMHSRGTPQTMQQLTHYDNLLQEVMDYFVERLARLKEAGVHDVILDPGFGFAKTLEQNYELFGHLEQLHWLERPLLVGVSRKSMIWRVLGTSAAEALHGSSALHALALQKGAHFIRVHDVKPAYEVRAIWELSQPKPPVPHASW